MLVMCAEKLVERQMMASFSNGSAAAMASVNIINHCLIHDSVN